MPRQSRIDAPGAIHHIMCRGIERRLIFKDDIDRDDFVRRLSSLCTETSTECLAWALIPNHFHLLLRTGQVPIATLMRRLLTGYAVKYNHRHGRHGHLFQNRYKSILCQEELYLLELVRYIHLNPLRARQVANMVELKDYTYSGHYNLMKARKGGWQSTDTVLERFGKRLSSSRKAYETFVSGGLSQGKRDDLIGGGLVRSNGGWRQVKQNRKAKLESKSDERILGESSFVEEVLRKVEGEMMHKTTLLDRDVTFDELLKQVARKFNLEPGALVRPSKQPLHVLARSILCYWSVRNLGMTASAVGNRINLTQSAVSRAALRGETITKEMGLTFLKQNA